MLVHTIQPPAPAHTPHQDQPLDIGPSTLPADEHHPFRDGLPELTQRQISYRIDRLARVFHLSCDDAEDLRGSLVLEVYRAMLRYDSGKS